LRDEFPGVFSVTHLTADRSDDALVDGDGTALRLLGVDGAAQYVIRPDGHVGFRCAGIDLTGTRDYLRRWCTPAGDAHAGRSDTLPSGPC
ncbi:MAG TPA: hypothetical protein VFJ02_16085, partial [Vicinamibacterales bacterium]|nr:hypothetical protein [Vicinamibacterales bacterium]